MIIFNNKYKKQLKIQIKNNLKIFFKNINKKILVNQFQLIILIFKLYKMILKIHVKTIIQCYKHCKKRNKITVQLIH